MKPEAQQIAISEACGWRQVREEDGWWNIEPSGKRHASLCDATHGMPDFLNDLNSMHDAERWMESNAPGTCLDYTIELRHVINPRFGIVGEFRLLTATAAQRAEAWLRVMGKRTEE